MASAASNVNDLSRFVQHPKYVELSPGQYTDDTQRSIANAVVIVENKPHHFKNTNAFNMYSYAEAYLQVYWRDARERTFKTNHVAGEYLNYGFEQFIYKRNVNSGFDTSMGGAPYIAVGMNCYPFYENNLKMGQYDTGDDLEHLNDTFDIWEANKT